jgi:hypothetical protein
MGDEYVIGKIDANKNNLADDDEISANWDKIGMFYSDADFTADMEAFEFVKHKDIALKEKLVRRYIEDNPRFSGADITKIIERDDDIIFYIMCNDGVERTFTPRFDKGLDNTLDETDSVEKMLLNINELNHIQDRDMRH